MPFEVNIDFYLMDHQSFHIVQSIHISNLDWFS